MAAKPRQATAEDLLGKPARTQSLPIDLGGRTVNVALIALSATAYDDLLGEHPPTKEQKLEGNGYNPDTFAPALISAVMAEPKLSVEQAAEIWKSETWSRGELRDLFMGCVNICSRGLDVPFTPAD